jgi:Superfamily I DNA and RNA helicases
MSGSVILAAYNKRIADEINDRISTRNFADVRASAATFHSIGFSALRNGHRGPRVWARKTWDVLDNIECPKPYRNYVDKLTSLAKQYGFGIPDDNNFAPAFPSIDDTDAYLQLVDHFDLESQLPRNLSVGDDDSPNTHNDTDPTLTGISYAKLALRESLRLATLPTGSKPGAVVDFDDMIWIPLITGARFPTYDWVLIDEAQDSNPARREITRRLCHPNTRVIAVGDPRQAIYGFTGANADSMDIIREQFNAIELPLTVSYRCPRLIVEHAHNWVSHIESHPGAPDGVLAEMYKDELLALPATTLDGHAAVLCRNTKPLVELCYRYLQAGIRAHVEGKEIGEGLVRLVEQFSKIHNLIALEHALEDYRDEECARLTAHNKHERAGALDDQIECLTYLIESLPGDSTTRDLIARIRSLFDDTTNGDKGLTLCTIHKSKGREWERVYWYGRDEYQPSKYATQEWQLEQEQNLYYVACTRAMRELTIVSSSDAPVAYTEEDN